MPETRPAPETEPAVPRPRKHLGPHLDWTFPAELGQIVLTTAATGVVYVLAGGDKTTFDRFAASGDLADLKPVFAAVLLFFVVLLSDTITGRVAKYRHNRQFNTWYADRHPTEAPNRSVVASVEHLVLACGPLTLSEIVARLAEGGSWGGPARVSPRAVLRILHDKSGRNPAPWLAPRRMGQPYAHIDAADETQVTPR